MNKPSEVFGRKDEEGNIVLLHIEDGSSVTRLDAYDVYPVGQSLSCKYEHPSGIVLSKADAERLGIEIEA